MGTPMGFTTKNDGFNCNNQNRLYRNRQQPRQGRRPNWSYSAQDAS